MAIGWTAETETGNVVDAVLTVREYPWPHEDQAISLVVVPDKSIRLNGLGLTEEQQKRVELLLWFWHNEASQEFEVECAAYAARQNQEASVSAAS